MRLRLDGRRLAVLSQGAPVAFVDTLTRRVTTPSAVAPPPPATTPAARPDAGTTFPWPLVAGSAAVALGAAAALLLARRRRASTVRP
jgi:hypothetical protein